MFPLLQEWEDNSQLTFTELDRDDSADIRINFYTYYHNDGNPFDGPGGRSLRHARDVTDFQLELLKSKRCETMKVRLNFFTFNDFY